MSTNLDSPINEEELAPGSSCPLCGEKVATWTFDQVVDLTDAPDYVPDESCWISASNFNTNSLTQGIAGNVVIIDHWDGSDTE